MALAVAGAVDVVAVVAVVAAAAVLSLSHPLGRQVLRLGLSVVLQCRWQG